MTTLLPSHSCRPTLCPFACYIQCQNFQPLLLKYIYDHIFFHTFHSYANFTSTLWEIFSLVFAFELYLAGRNLIPWLCANFHITQPSRHTFYLHSFTVSWESAVPLTQIKILILSAIWVYFPVPRCSQLLPRIKYLELFDVQSNADIRIG